MQSFGTVPDEQRCAHRGIFYLFLLVDGIELLAKDISAICFKNLWADSGGVFLCLLFWQFVFEEVHGRICNNV